MGSEKEPSTVTLPDGLEKATRSVREVLWQMEGSGGVSRDSDLEQELVYFLKRLCTQLMVGLDHLGLEASRRELARAWRGFVKAGLDQVVYYPQYGTVGSEAHDYLDAVIDVIRVIVPSPATLIADEHAEVLRLERFLDRTAYILQKRGLAPTKESQIQKVMDEYLEAIYGPDYHRQFTVPGVVKNFRPDSGIRSLGAVIEFKFAASPAKLKTAVAGLFEDASSYRASSDWKRYYSVIYMTGAHGTREQVAAAFTQAEMIDWKPVLVTGASSKLARIGSQNQVRAKRRPGRVLVPRS
jgi:hypothetical protein